MVKNKSINKLIGDTVHLCTEHNIAFKLIQKNKVPLGNGLTCNGYFWIDDSKRELVVGMKKPIKEWLPIFVHESCHLDQYIDNPTKYTKDDGTAAIDEWLLGKDYSKSKIKKLIGILRRLELDCEKRTVKKIIKYDLPISVAEYTQRSNLYVHFHNWMYLRRSWIPNRKTLYQQELIAAMNTTFDSSYSSTPQYYIDLLDKHLLNK